MIGLDTSAIIDLFRGDKAVKEVLLNINESLAVTQLSYLELMFGLDPKNEKHKLEESFYDEFFKSLLNFNLTNQSCKKASEVFWSLKKEGKTIEQFDCVIAGIFLANGINTIISGNAKHFSSINRLKIIEY